MNGLFTTFFPVIGFFYVAEIDGKRKEGEAEIKEQVEDYIENYFEASREDDLKIFRLWKKTSVNIFFRNS